MSALRHLLTLRRAVLTATLVALSAAAAYGNFCYGNTSGICYRDGEPIYRLIPAGLPCAGEGKWITVVGVSYGDTVRLFDYGSGLGRVSNKSGGICVFSGYYVCQGEQVDIYNELTSGRREDGKPCPLIV